MSFNRPCWLTPSKQFYLLWPLAAWFVVRWRSRGGWLIAGLLLLSFTINVVWVVGKAKGTFFLLPTRAWELLIGAAWAHFVVFSGGRLRLRAPVWADRCMPDLLAVLGVLLIAAALALLDKSRQFPGWWALLPTGGTVLLLAAGPQAWLNRHVLSHRVLVFYGAISYPLYLWHWPLLVFPVLLGVELNNAWRVLILTASVGLAALTLEFVERPLRAGAWGRHTAAALCGVMAALGLAGLSLVASDGLIGTYPKAVQMVARSEFGFDYGEYRSSRCFLDLEQGPARFAAECAGRAGGLMLWGDSHAASLFPGLARSQAGLAGGPALAQYTKARCPPLMNLPAGTSRGCAEANAFVMQQVQRTRPATVVLGGYWSLYGTDAQGVPIAPAEIRRTVQALEALGVQHVIVMGHLPTWTVPLPRVLLTTWRASGDLPERSRAALNPRAHLLDRAVRDALVGSSARFISPMELLCNGSGCLVTQQRDGVIYPVAHDESHLTAEGSALLIQRSTGSQNH